MHRGRGWRGEKKVSPEGRFGENHACGWRDPNPGKRDGKSNTERSRVEQGGTMEELGAGDGQHKNLLEQGHMNSRGQITVVREV